MADNSFAVDLSNKSLAKIPEKVRQKCKDVQELNLSRNQFCYLDDVIGNFKNLEILNLSWNCLIFGLNPSVGRLRHLKNLQLHNCGLQNLPDSFGDLKELEVLNLSGNHFTKGVNQIVGRLRHLKNLDLSYCQLQNLPDSFMDLEELTILNLRANCLTEYPSCILNLKNLKTLDLSYPGYEQPRLRWKEPCYEAQSAGRRCCDIDEEEMKTKQRLRKCGISSLPMVLAESNLRELILEGNPITDPPEAIWRQRLDAIKSYLREKRLGADELCPDTINMIGDVFAGKTSIAQSLVQGSPSPAADDDRSRVLQQFQVGFGENGKLLVNINDFGGHPIYHCAIPIFLPADGLTILAYDMSLSVEEQKDTVSRWLLTAIAKLKSFRVTVAGTRCDRYSRQDELKDMEKNMFQFVSSLINDAKREIRLSINRLEQRSSNSDEKKVIHLRDLLKRINNADISVVSLSCLEPNPGLSELRDNVSKKLRHGDSMPLRWFLVMKSILHASSNRPYLTWGEVQKLYRDQVPDTNSDKDLVVILRYLVSTSQVLWLEHHEKLKEVIFHSPKSILKVCKDVLSHDHVRQATSQSVCVTDKDRERYSKGIVQQPFMMELISDKEVAPVAIEFLKNFNFISEIAADDGTIAFVIPSNLPAKEPPLMRDLEQRLHSCPNSVIINFTFLGSVLPKSFFETSLSYMLTISTSLFKHGMSTEQWRDGLIILYHKVCFIAKRRDNILTLEATSNVWTSNPWTILLPIVKGIYENITASWHGATQESSLLCPACRMSRLPEAVGEKEITLETLVTEVQHNGATWMCIKCAETIPPCLFFPLPRDSLTADELDELETFFIKHGMDVSGGVDQSSVTTNKSFLEDTTGVVRLSSNYQVDWTTVCDDDAREALRKSYYELTRLLNCIEVTDYLYSRIVLSDDDVEAIKSCRNPRDVRRCLLDSVRTRGQRGFQVFAEALLKTRQDELYNIVMQSLRMQIPEAFKTEPSRD